MALELPVADSKQRNPRVPLTELEQSAFCQVEPLETKPLAEELKRWSPVAAAAGRVRRPHAR